MSKNTPAATALVDRIFGYDGSPVVPLSGSKFLCPTASGVATLTSNTALSEADRYWSVGDGVHQITTIAVNKSQTMMVAAERKLRVSLYVYTYPERELVQVVDNAAKIEIADMAFSRDGAFLAILSGPPSCSLSLYTVNSTTRKLSLYREATEQFGHHLRRITFSPTNPEVICGSGGGYCVFWTMNEASAALTPLEATTQNPNTRVTSHQWMPDGSVICGTTSGGLLHFTDLTAPVGVPIGPTQHQGQGVFAVSDLTLTKSHLVTLSPEGKLSFFSAKDITANHTSIAAAPTRSVETGVPKASYVRLVPEHNAFVVGGSSGTVQCVALPGYVGDLRDDEFELIVPKKIPLQVGFGGPLVGVAHGKGASIAVVSKSSLLTIVDYSANKIKSQMHIGVEPIAVCGVTRKSCVAITSQTGSIRIVSFESSALDPKIIFKGRFSDTQMHLIACDPTGTRLVAADSQYLFHFSVSDDGLSADFVGCVRLTNVMGVNAIAFLPNGNGLVVSHASGDTILTTIPSADTFGNVDNTDIKTIDQSAVFVNTWRLDTPVYNLIVAAAYDDYLNILTQSLDKAGRLYLLDRTLSAERKDRESRVVKAQVLIGDHEKKGTRLRLAFNNKFSLSAGSDGKLCVRDALMYVKPWTPQPLTKERNEPLSVHVCHASLRGGIASFCVGFDSIAAKRVVTAGVDGFVVVWNTPIPALTSPTPLEPKALTVDFDLSDPIAVDNDDELFFTDKNRKEAAQVDAVRYQTYRETVQHRIEALRAKLETIRAENESSAEDEKVNLEDFLVERHRKAFDEAVDAAVNDMKSNVELGNLKRDYLADLIKRECWDVMAIKLTPLVALNTPNLVVYNFHQRHADSADAKLIRKLKFLRIVEETDRRHRKVHELEDVYDGPRVDPFTSGGVLEKLFSGEATDVSKAASSNKAGPTTEAASPEQDGGDGGEELHKDLVEELMAKPLMEQAGEDPAPYLYNPLLTFTRGRSVIQKMLLRGRIQSLKNRYNGEFNALVERKHTELHHIKERNTRCRLVLKELGEEREVFDPQMSTMEDPAHVFKVNESAITTADKSTDPEEKRRQVQLEIERKRWIERNGTDGSSDKALKVWMDGRLDKDIRTLEINIPLPDFADEENVDKYVPPEERTDDQVRIFKDYETALQKRIEEVNIRREQLRSEFDKLQKQNIAAAKAFDDAIINLAHRRLVVSQYSSQVELSQIKLVQSVLTQSERIRIAQKIEQRRKSLSEHLQRINMVYLKANAAYEKITTEVNTLRDEERAKEKNLRTFAPFTDRDYGEKLVRHYNRKLKAKRRAQAENPTAGHEDHSMGGPYAVGNGKSPIMNATQDAFAFIEITAAHKEQLKQKFIQQAQEDQLRQKQQHHSHEQASLAAVTSFGGDFSSEQFSSANFGGGLLANERPSGDLLGIGDELWDAYISFRVQRNEAEAEINRLTAEQDEAEERLSLVQDQRARISDALSEAVRTFELFLTDSIEEQYDIDGIYNMQQGQVEVDQAPVVMNFDDAVMIRVSIADRLNDLIRASNAEKLAAMTERIMRLKEMSLIEWEVEFYVFAMRSLELQLKHLHTLRVTKQMQEFINGGGDDHNEQERKKLAIKIDHVRATMAEKIEDRRLHMQRLKRTIRDKEVENYILQDQVGESKALVDDRRSIRDLQSSEVDHMRTDRLMRDMRVTRKLEDVAKAQQAEMGTTKKEIDRLRERTFPSFAVVSKRVVGNPDQL